MFSRTLPKSNLSVSPFNEIIGTSGSSTMSPGSKGFPLYLCLVVYTYDWCLCTTFQDH